MRDTEKLQFASKLVGEVELPEQKREKEQVQESIQSLREDAFDKRIEDAVAADGTGADASID